MSKKRFSHFSKLGNFYLFQTDQFVSMFGSKMTSFGLILWSYTLSGSVLSTSLLTVCSLLPSIALSFLAGSLIDRWNKKSVMLLTNVVATLLSLTTLTLILTGLLRIEYIYLINILFGVIDAFQAPASSVIVSLIVPREGYMHSSAVQSFLNAFMTMFAPIVATSLYAFWGLRVIVSVDLGTFVFALITLFFFVRVPDESKAEEHERLGVIQSCRMGLGYLKSYKPLLHMILYLAFVNLIASVYGSSLAPMVLSRTGNNEFELGIVSGSVGIAGLVGSILVSITRPPKKRVPLILNIMSFSFLFCNCLLGVGGNFTVWTFAVFLGNCLIPFLTANMEFIMRTRVPIGMQGRVFAARNTLQFFTIPIGYVAGGFLADKLFEPLMAKPSSAQQFLSLLVGSGKGSGIALIYVAIGLLGFIGTTAFRFDRTLKKLDDPEPGPAELSAAAE